MSGEETYHERYLSLGLGFFHALVKASHVDQMHILGDNARISYSSLSSALEEEAPEWDNPMYDAWTDRALQGFYGDNDKDDPNAAWTWSTGNKVEIRYYQSNKVGLRKWGYVMWDKERLDQWNILQENYHDYLIE